MRRFLISLLLLVGAGLLGAGWYAYDKGFTRKWRGFVSSEFRKRGVEMWLSKLTLDPFRGIIAKNVQVYDGKERRRTLAVVDEMRLVINWANLVQGKAFLDALDLTDANLSLPIDPGNPRGAKIDITGLSGRLFLPPQQVYLSRLEADLYGVHLTASGRLINPQKFRMERPKSTAKPPAAVEFAEKVVDELRRLKFSGSPPQLNLRFSGDLGEPEKVFVELTLWAEHAGSNDLQLETLYLAGSFRQGRVELRELVATDKQGMLQLGGEYDVAAKAASLHLQSTMDPAPLGRAFGASQIFSDLTFHGAPSLDLTARASFASPGSAQVLGHLNSPAFTYKGVDFDSLAGDFSSDGERWSAREVQIVHHTGQITGDIMQVPGDLRTRLKSTINPKIIRPLLTGAAADWFSQFDFADPATIEAEAHGASLNPGTFSGSGQLKLGRTSYRGVSADSVIARLRYADRKLVIDPLQVQRTEGAGAGGLTFDFARNEVRIDKVRTSLYPTDVVMWVDQKLLKDITPYRFGKQPPTLEIDGIVHTKGGDSTKLNINVDAPGGMDYTFLRRDLHFPDIEAKLFFTFGRMKIDDLSANLFGGMLRGGAEISLLRDKPGHAARMKLENVDFQSLTKLYFGFDQAKGRVNAHYDFTGKGDDARKMQGEGALTVTDGDVFAIPFLGPLSGILNSIVPGMGSDVARKGSASFTISTGVINTQNLEIVGNGFSMIGNGDLFFLDDHMDFDVRINARGLPGVLLFPVSKLFEYVADDKLSKPKWRPKAFPKM